MQRAGDGNSEPLTRRLERYGLNEVTKREVEAAPAKREQSVIQGQIIYCGPQEVVILPLDAGELSRLLEPNI